METVTPYLVNEKIIIYFSIILFSLLILNSLNLLYLR